MWLDKILRKGLKIRLAESGSELPENPTMDDFKKEGMRIVQLAKELQNTEHHWSDKQWREISKALEGIEDKCNGSS